MLFIEKVEGMGNGVFTGKDFKSGDLIEKCPILYIPESQFDRYIVNCEEIDNHTFDWFGGAAILFGYGSLYNHSYNPNAKYVRDQDNKMMEFYAIKDIYRGEQIFINYNGLDNEFSNDPLWFHENYIHRDLLNCPFCGTAPKIGSLGGDKENWAIYCPNSGCGVPCIENDIGEELWRYQEKME